MTGVAGGRYRDLAITPGKAEYNFLQQPASPEAKESVWHVSPGIVDTSLFSAADPGCSTASWNPEVLVEGSGKVLSKPLLEGDVFVSMYQCEQTSLTLTQPYPHDEAIIVLEGELRLELPGAEAPVIGQQGDVVLVPANTSFTMTMNVGAEGVYRELATGSTCIAKDSLMSKL